MGRVLLARDLIRDEKTVALKILLPEYRHSTAGFMQEFVTQRSFEHPNIPAVYEVGFAKHPRGGEVPYFTLEYCRGISLILAIPRLRKLDRAFRWMFQVLRALDYVHGRGWLHRDLKPGNVLVDMDDESDTAATLIDLGVASKLGEPPEDVFIGTPEYCSPEVLAGYQFDERSDLYALGLCLYEVIEKRRPWAGSDESELLSKRLETAPPPITHPECPEGVKRLVMDLLKPSPRDRPRTAAEAIHRLNEAAGVSEPIETVPAFARRLEAIQLPGRTPIYERGLQCMTGLLPGEVDEKNLPKVFMIEGPRSFEPSRIANELADRNAVQGTRVVRVSLEGPAREPLSAIQPILDVFRRLREEAGQEVPDGVLMEGAAGAAALLTRLHGSTIMVIENLQRADAHTLHVLGAVFTGSRVPLLRLVCTADPSETPHASRAWEKFASGAYIQRASLPVLSLEETAHWVEEALGRGVLDVPLITRVHGVSGGTGHGIVSAIVNLYRRGVLRREVRGYVVEGDVDRALPSATTEQMGELEERIACIRHALPEAVVESYLEEYADQLDLVVAQGKLVRRPDGLLAPADEEARQDLYRRVHPVQKMQHHRRLARAVHAGERFPNQRSYVAFELMVSDRPVLAAPHLVVAASDVVGAESAAQARSYLDRAEVLLHRHITEADKDEAWRWWVMLWKARVRLALTEGDIDALDEATEKLAELGTEAAHITTLRFALETRMVIAFERGDWEALVKQARARLTLDGKEPSPDAVGLLAWAEGLHAQASGDVDRALRSLDDGLALEPKRPRPGVTLRLASAKADLLVENEWVREARKFLPTYATAAESATDEAHGLRARLLEAALDRQAGRPHVALERIRDVAREMPPEHLRKVSSLLELELARTHAEFGWSDTARDHAQQALSLAQRDKDAVGEAAAALVDAQALRHARQGEAAHRIVRRALSLVSESRTWSLFAETRLLKLRLEAEGSAPADARHVATECEAMAEECSKRQQHARASRFLAAGAQAATAIPDPGLALELAERALLAVDRRPGWEAGVPWILYILAGARRAARRHQKAEALAQRALEELRRLASAIEDEKARKSWLSTPDHALILGLAGPPPPGPPGS